MLTHENVLVALCQFLHKIDSLFAIDCRVENLRLDTGYQFSEECKVDSVIFHQQNTESILALL